MDAQQLIAEASKLTVEEQRKLLETLTADINKASLSEENREQEALDTLLAKGTINCIPPYWNEDEDFEPETIEGEPLSETIIRERR